jgi:hypothetical protein
VKSGALLVPWGLGLVLLYVLGAWFGVRALHRARIDTEQRRQGFMETAAFGRNAKSIDVRAFEGAEPVTVGLFVTRVGDLDVRSGEWAADFDVWFRWRGEALHPGETFQLVNGDIGARDKVETTNEGGEHYERWRMHAKLTSLIDPARYPFGDEALTIQIEEGRHGAQQLRYVADTQASGVAFDALPEGFVIKQSLAAVKYIQYASTLGHASTDAHEVRSRFVFAMLGSPPSVLTHLKNFQALFASVAISLLVFFIRPIHVDPRFGLGVGAAFAAVTNNIAVAASVPTVHDFTLTAMINAVGLGTIFLTMVESAISLYLLDTLGLEKLYRQLDKLSFAILLAGYVTLNVVLPLAAQS